MFQAPKKEKTEKKEEVPDNLPVVREGEFVFGVVSSFVLFVLHQSYASMLRFLLQAHIYARSVCLVVCTFTSHSSVPPLASTTLSST